MINANELMLGNWVNHIMQNVKLTPNILLNISNDSRNYSPIQLTPEILEKAGFERVNHIHGYTFYSSKKKLGNPCIYVYDTKTEVMGYMVSHVKYVHQLQNLYFALTGQQLEINL